MIHFQILFRKKHKDNSHDMVPKAGYIIEDDIKIIREEPFMSAKSFMITCGKQASLPNVAREVVLRY